MSNQDAISRKAAIRALEELYSDGDGLRGIASVAVERIIALPSISVAGEAEQDSGETAQYHAELWIDDRDGTANFKWHIEGGTFPQAREVLQKFIHCLQTRLENQSDCPLFEPEQMCVHCGKDLVYHHHRNLKCPDRETVYQKQPESPTPPPVDERLEEIREQRRHGRVLMFADIDYLLELATRSVSEEAVREAAHTRGLFRAIEILKHVRLSDGDEERKAWPAIREAIKAIESEIP